MSTILDVCSCVHFCEKNTNINETSEELCRDKINGKKRRICGGQRIFGKKIPPPPPPLDISVRRRQMPAENIVAVLFLAATAAARRPKGIVTVYAILRPFFGGIDNKKHETLLNAFTTTIYY